MLYQATFQCVDNWSGLKRAPVIIVAREQRREASRKFRSRNTWVPFCFQILCNVLLGVDLLDLDK